MWDFVKVAWRNVGRNKRRSLITVLTVFLGVVVSTATRGLLDGLQTEIKNGLTRKMHGDLQIHKQGYQDSLENNPYKLLIPSEYNAISWPVAPRLKVMALLNHQKSQTTTPVVVTGIDSSKENLVCPRFAESVLTGKMLDSSLEKPAEFKSDDELGEAQGLEASNSTLAASTKAEGFQQILLTPGLQRGLGAELGDEFVVLINDKDNMQQAIIARFVGTVDVGIPGAAARMAWMDFTSLQRTLQLQGFASELALRIPEGTEAEAQRAKLVNDLKNPELIVETWKELGGQLRDAMAMQDVIFTAIVAIMFAIVIAAIVNTSLMTVMERTREIGTLMALGYRRRHILTLFLLESAMIGGAGGLSGIGAGIVFTSVFNVYGITFTLPGQTVSTVLYPTTTPAFLLLIFTLSVLAALIAGFVPALRASHLKPVDALTST